VTNVASSSESPTNVGRLLDDGRWTGYQQRLVALTALAVIFDGADNQLLGTAIPAIMRDWQLTRAAFAPVLALGMAGMMIGGAIAGLAGDRIGRKTALIASVFLFGVATAALATVSGLQGLMMVRFLAGLGLGGAIPNAAALSAEFVPQRHRPLAVTLTIVCVPLGGTIAGLLALRVLPTLGWRALFLIGGAIPMITALILLGALAESPRYLASRPTRWPELRRLLARMGHVLAKETRFAQPSTAAERAGLRALLLPDWRRDTVALWCAYFSCLLAVYLGFNWVPSMLTGAGLRPEIGSTGITAFNVGGVFGAITGALTFPRAGSRATMLTLVGGAAISAMAMSALHIAPSTSIVSIMTLLTLTGGFINAVQTTMFSLAAQIYPTAIRATGVGTAVSLGRSGALLSTYVGAWALDAGGPRAFFLVVACAMIACGVALAIIRRHIPSAGQLAREVGAQVGS
jgi:MFS transporter, AAHS family, 4-hydroxybenzoate transporter